ncbi:S8 family serine peptidase [Bacillus cereus]|nr:S8 family serine peptidase [Bacillus cereus]
MVKKFNIVNRGCMLFFFCFVLYFNNSVSANSDYIDNSYIITMKEEGVSGEISEELIHKFPDIKFEFINDIGVIKIHGNNEEITQKVLSYINKMYAVDSVSKDKRIYIPETKIDNSKVDKNNFVDSQYKYFGFTPSFMPNGLYTRWQWNIDAVTANKKSYEFQMGNHEVTVAIIDSGIDPNHPDLKNNIVAGGKSFIPGDESINDNTGHGTMVAGIIAANGDLKGIAPNTGIAPYKVLNSEGGQSTWVITAIIQAVDDGHEIINLSLGTFLSLKNKEEKALIKAYNRAINYAHKKGALVVASAGNQGIDLSNPRKVSEQLGILNDEQKYAPGGLNSALSVGAVDKNNKFENYSNYGWMLDVTAPGGDFGPLYEKEGIVDVRHLILTTYPTYLPNYIAENGDLPRGYEFSYGTSLSTPTVSAVAALILTEYKEEKSKNLSIDEIQNIMYQTTLKVGTNRKEKLSGRGTVDAYEALKLINNK